MSSETESMKRVFDRVNMSLQRFGEKYPSQMKAFGGFVKAVESPGALDVKTKELIAIALSVATHCQSCIAYHVKKALEQGASRKEIEEAGWVSVLMGGGPSLMYFQLVEQALSEFEK